MVADSNWGPWFLVGDFAGTKEAQKRHTSYTIYMSYDPRGSGGLFGLSF